MSFTYEQTTTLLAKLPPAVTKIKAIYSGSGDSGDFEEISFYDHCDRSIKVDDSTLSLFEQLFLSLLEERWEGWEINDGANGVIEVDVAARAVDHQHISYSSEWDDDSYEI